MGRQILQHYLLAVLSQLGVMLPLLELTLFYLRAGCLVEVQIKHCREQKTYLHTLLWAQKLVLLFPVFAA